MAKTTITFFFFFNYKLVWFMTDNLAHRNKLNNS